MLITQNNPCERNIHRPVIGIDEEPAGKYTGRTERGLTMTATGRTLRAEQSRAEQSRAEQSRISLLFLAFTAYDYFRRRPMRGHP